MKKADRVNSRVPGATSKARSTSGKLGRYMSMDRGAMAVSIPRRRIQTPSRRPLSRDGVAGDGEEAVEGGETDMAGY